MNLCGACHGQLNGDLQPRPELCAKCYPVFAAIEILTEPMRDHVLAHTLVRSAKDAARRLDCPNTAHSSALGNATVRTGLGRDELRRVALWALKAGVYSKPAGFEDVTLPGYGGSPSGEVTVSKREPEKKASKERPRKETSDVLGLTPSAPDGLMDVAEREPEPEPEPEYREKDGWIPGKVEQFAPTITTLPLITITDPALEALYRLACPSDERQASRDLVTVAYELGRARGGLDAFNGES